MASVISFTRGLSSDIIVFAVVFLAVTAYGLYRGKESLVSLLLSFYLAAIAYSSAPFLKSLLLFKSNSTQVFFSKAVIFLILVILINFVVDKIIGATYHISKVRNWLEIVALSLAVAISAIAIAFNILSFSLVYTPNLISASFLASGTALFGALIGSLIILFFAAK